MAMQMKYLYRKGIDKDPKIIFKFLDCYWQEFINLNKDRESSSKIILPRRSHLIKKVGYARRNAYKHIKQLLFYNILQEEDDRLLPTAFIYSINNMTYNPSRHFFNYELPLTLRKEEHHMTTPKVSLLLLSFLLSAVQVEGNTLSDFLSISFDVPMTVVYSSSYHYAAIPRSFQALSGWNQKKPGIRDFEERLLKILTPYKDPMNHNTISELRSGDETNLIRLDELTSEYVLAGWCTKVNNNVLEGRYADTSDSNSMVNFYGETRELIESVPITFPSSLKGIPMMARMLVIGTRIRNSNNPNLLGYYDFKNNIPSDKYSRNHVLLSFSRIKAPRNARYLRIETHRNSYFSLTALFPFSAYPADIIKKRMQAGESRDYVQNLEPIFHIEQCPEIKDLSEYQKVNVLAQKASYEIENKQTLLQAHKHARNFNNQVEEQIAKILKKGAVPSDAFVRLVNSTMACSLLLPLSIKDKTDAFNEENAIRLKQNYKLLRGLIKLLYKKKGPTEVMSCLVMNHYRQFRDLRLYFKQDAEIKEFKKFMDQSIGIINHSTDVNFRIELSTWRLQFEKAAIGNPALFKKGVVSIADVEKAYNDIADMYMSYACAIEKSFEKADDKSEKEVLQNKYNYFKTQSFFYKFSSILFRTKYYEGTSKEREKFEELHKLLGEIGSMMF